MKMIKQMVRGREWVVRDDTADENIIFEVYTSELYDLDYIENVKVVVDVGAHIGGFSVKCAEKFKNSTIYSFEPIWDNFLVLQENVREFPNIKTYNKCVSGDRIPTELASTDKHNTGSNIYNYELTDITSVKSIHINELIKMTGMIDLLKLDCEGGENSIFDNLDFNKVRYIVCELHSYGNIIGMDETVEKIKNNGFEILYLIKCNKSIYNLVARRKCHIKL